MSQLISLMDMQRSYSVAKDQFQSEGSSMSQGLKSGKSSNIELYSQNQSQSFSKEFSKQAIKSKQLQNCDTIKWLKKRYINKTNDHYIFNQEDNFKGSEDIIGIYNDLANNSQNSSKESFNSENKRLQIEDVCGYLQKNDVNISKMQLAKILNKKQQNYSEINMSDFHKIMMSHTLNERFKKCLKSQDMQQNQVNAKFNPKKKLRQNLNQIYMSSDQLDIQSDNQTNKILILQENPTIDNLTNRNHTNEKVEVNRKINDKKINKELNQLKQHKKVFISPNIQQNKIISNKQQQKENYSFKEELGQLNQNRTDINNQYILKETDRTDKSLKNMMNNMHFQMKRKKILHEFEKSKENSKIRASLKCDMLENLLNLPQYQGKNYKQNISSTAQLITPNTQFITSNEKKISSFLPTLEQLDKAQSHRNTQSNSKSPKKQKENDNIQTKKQTVNEKQQSHRNEIYVNKENSYLRDEDHEIGLEDQVNGDESEYELQMLVQRAKYKAKQQLKKEILQNINFQNKNNIESSISIIQQPQKSNSNLANNNKIMMKQIRTNSLMTNNNSKQNQETKRSQNDIYIQMYDESTDKSHIQKDNKQKSQYTVMNNLKNRYNQKNGNMSTEDSYNLDVFANNDEDRSKSFDHHNYTCLSSQQLDQLPIIHQNNNSANQINTKNDNQLCLSINKTVNCSFDNSSRNQNSRRKFISVFSQKNNDQHNKFININFQNPFHDTSVLNNINQSNENILTVRKENQKSVDNDQLRYISNTFSQKNAININQINNDKRRYLNQSLSNLSQQELININSNTNSQQSHLKDQYAPKIQFQKQKRSQDVYNQIFLNNYKF